MTTALLSHADCLNHETPPGHPERVDRLHAIMQALDGPDFADLARIDAPLALNDQIESAHPSSYITQIEAAAPDHGSVAVDADTHMSPGSYTAALRAAGAVVKGVDLVMSGEADNSFCAVRPPGHHAETARAMGFCLFGNAVIGARHALDRHGLERVAIVDFDVHHGNGTQDLAWNDPRIFFASTHQMPLYPGSGAAAEVGGSGNVLNVPLKAGDDGRALRAAFNNQILPALNEFSPQLVFISAGFDAHSADPLANLEFSEEDYTWATQELCKIADNHAGGRVVSTLEGGYDLGALATSTAAHVKVLMGQGR